MVWYFAIKRYDHFLLIFWAITHVQNLFDVVVSNYQLRRHLKWSTTFLSPYSYMKHVDRQPHSFHYWLLIVGNCQRWWFLIFLSFSMTSHGGNEMTHICRILICRLWHYPLFSDLIQRIFGRGMVSLKFHANKRHTFTINQWSCCSHHCSKAIEWK